MSSCRVVYVYEAKVWGLGLDTVGGAQWRGDRRSIAEHRGQQHYNGGSRDPTRGFKRSLVYYWQVGAGGEHFRSTILILDSSTKFIHRATRVT